VESHADEPKRIEKQQSRHRWNVNDQRHNALKRANRKNGNEYRTDDNRNSQTCTVTERGNPLSPLSDPFKGALKRPTQKANS
jgi:hypothetical protein